MNFPRKQATLNLQFNKGLNLDSCKNNFICEICDRSFTINQRKNRHIQQVHGEKTRSDEVKCDVCGKSFTASSSLKNTSSLFLEDKAL